MRRKLEAETIKAREKDKVLALLENENKKGMYSDARDSTKVAQLLKELDARNALIHEQTENAAASDGQRKELYLRIQQDAQDFQASVQQLQQESKKKEQAWRVEKEALCLQLQEVRIELATRAERAACVQAELQEVRKIQHDRDVLEKDLKKETAAVAKSGIMEAEHLRALHTEEMRACKSDAARRCAVLEGEKHALGEKVAHYKDVMRSREQQIAQLTEAVSQAAIAKDARERDVRGEKEAWTVAQQQAHGELQQLHRQIQSLQAGAEEAAERLRVAQKQAEASRKEKALVEQDRAKLETRLQVTLHALEASEEKTIGLVHRVATVVAEKANLLVILQQKEQHDKAAQQREVEAGALASPSAAAAASSLVVAAASSSDALIEALRTLKEVQRDVQAVGEKDRKSQALLVQSLEAKVAALAEEKTFAQDALAKSAQRVEEVLAGANKTKETTGRTVQELTEAKVALQTMNQQLREEVSRVQADCALLRTQAVEQVRTDQCCLRLRARVHTEVQIDVH